MKYWKNYFEELLDEPEWGFSTWYLELDDHSLPVRQVVVFDSGPVLRQEREKHELSHTPIVTSSHSEYKFTEISSDDFDRMWESA